MADEVNTQGTQEGTERNGNGTAQEPEKKYSEEEMNGISKKNSEKPFPSLWKSFLML